MEKELEGTVINSVRVDSRLILIIRQDSGTITKAEYSSKELNLNFYAPVIEQGRRLRLSDYSEQGYYKMIRFL